MLLPTVFKIGRKVLSGPIENTGKLPTRYYLQQSVLALKNNDLEGAVKYLLFCKDQVKNRRVKFVTQQIIFKIRLLVEENENKLVTVQAIIDRIGQENRKLKLKLWVMKYGYVGGGIFIVASGLTAFLLDNFTVLLVDFLPVIVLIYLYRRRACAESDLKTMIRYEKQKKEKEALFHEFTKDRDLLVDYENNLTSFLAN